MFLYFILFYFCIFSGRPSLFLALGRDVGVVCAFRRIGGLLTVIFVAKAQIDHIGLGLVLLDWTRGLTIFTSTAFSHTLTFCSKRVFFNYSIKYN